MKPLLPVAEALSRLLDTASPILRTETVTLHQACGRVLAGDLTARVSHPAFDASAMDGYAVRHDDIASTGALLQVIGESAAGHAFDGRVEPGQAVRIFTGAPVPPGADTVLIQEDAEKRDNSRITTLFAPDKGRHIRLKGQDFNAGDIVLRKGNLIDVGRLTVAAGMNHAALTVLARPTVAILATGDELVAPGSSPGKDQIIASNTFGVAALARESGADVVDLGIVADDTAAIAAAVAHARAIGADVLVTLGGASVGDHDLVQSALLGSGMTLDFWRTAMRPGKPLVVGRLEGMHVLGLPGNPVSSLVCALLFLEPLLRHLASLPAADRIGRAVTASAFAANDKRQDYVRARLTRDVSGLMTAHPFARQDSSMMQVFAQADCLVIRPPEAPALAEGEDCDILMLRAPR